MNLPLSVYGGQLHDTTRLPVTPRCRDFPLTPAVPDWNGWERQFASGQIDLLRIALDAGSLCDDDGQLLDSEPLRRFDRILELAESNRIAVMLTMMSRPPSPVKPESERLNTFGSFTRRGMLIWHESSTEMQERYLGGFFCRRNFCSGRYTLEYRSLAVIRLYESADEVMGNIGEYFGATTSPYAEAFARHREKHRHSRQDLPEAELETAFRRHILRRSIMFTQPQLLHAFGNRVLLSFGGGTVHGEWSELYEAELKHNALFGDIAGLSLPEVAHV